MERTEFFDALVTLFEQTNVEFEELLDDDGEGGIYVRFMNVQTDAED